MLNIEGLSDSDLTEVTKNLQVELGLKDLYYFNESILGHNKITKHTHGELLSLVDSWGEDKKSFIVLLPRGTFKTHLISEGYTIREIIKNPNIRIYLFGETYTKMVRYAGAIKEHLTSTTLTDLYGIQKDPTYWREEGFRVRGRTILDKDPTLMVGGIDKPATGSHFDLIICDDLLGETNTETSDQLEKSKRRFEELSSMLNPGGMIVVVGTIWDEDDLYCDLITKKEGFTDWDKLLKERKYEGRDWNVYIRRAKEPDGTYFFPERLGEEALSKIERSQSSLKHRCQFYNDPQRTGVVCFTDEWRDAAMEGWDRHKKLNFPEVTDEWIVIDPAISKNPKADFSAIELFGITPTDDRYIIECHQDRLDTLELIEAIFSMASRRPKVRGIIIEASGFQKVLVSLITAEKIKRGKSYKIIEYNPGNIKSKESRIENLVPRMRQGKLFYSRDFVDLDMQFRKFPNIKKTDHDDALDCVSIAELAIKTRLPVDPKLYLPEEMSNGIPVMNISIGI